MIWVWRATVEWYWQGKTEELGETRPSATLSTTNPTWIDPGANPGLRGERPATNDLSNGTALSTNLLKNKEKCRHFPCHILASSNRILSRLQGPFNKNSSRVWKELKYRPQTPDLSACGFITCSLLGIYWIYAHTCALWTSFLRGRYCYHKHLVTQLEDYSDYVWDLGKNANPQNSSLHRFWPVALIEECSMRTTEGRKETSLHLPFPAIPSNKLQVSDPVRGSNPNISEAKNADSGYTWRR
jgi:hypothetical protein